MRNGLKWRVGRDSNAAEAQAVQTPVQTSVSGATAARRRGPRAPQGPRAVSLSRPEPGLTRDRRRRHERTSSPRTRPQRAKEVRRSIVSGGPRLRLGRRPAADPSWAFSN